MPTGDQYDSAAARLAAARHDSERLAATIEAIDPRTALIGGRLGTLVPLRLDDGAQTLVRVSALVAATERRCRERAAVIRAYEAALAAYDVQMVTYQSELAAWHARRAAAADDVSVPYGPRPIEPVPPAPPPAWADVPRR